MENEERIQRLEKELKQTKATLDKLNTNFDDFIHLAAHDLQSPVRKTITLLDRFNQKYGSAIPDDGISYLDRINKSLNSMTTIIEGLARLGAITTNPDIHQPISLSELMDKIRNAVIKNDPSIVINVGDLPVINGIPDEIRQLFTELIMNSIKFKRPDVPVEIYINAYRLSEEEKIVYNLAIEKIYTIITLHDNGIGFKAEMSDRIVKPFQRLHGNSSYPGNGIGLAICKKIAESHYGKFIITAKEHEGTLCSIIFPELQN